MKPSPLKKGDRIAIAAPAGPMDQGGRKRFVKAVSLLRKSGFQATFQKNIFARQDYLAGDDWRRSQEIKACLASPHYKALLFARGGYGCQRLLPLLSGHCSPKVVVGCSDLTVLLHYLWQRFRLPSYYGPMVVPHLVSQKNLSRLEKALTDPEWVTRQKIIARKVVKPGRAEGTLVGGCLSLVVSTLGTPWELQTDNSLLFLEDTNEEPYEVDRMLTQLEQAGKFRKVRGILFGTFRTEKNLFPSKIEEVIREKFRSFRGPVLWGLRFGHCSDPLFIPIGGRGLIDGKRLVITKGIF